MQIILLLATLEWYWQERNDFFASANPSIYYNLNQLNNWDWSIQPPHEYGWASPQIHPIGHGDNDRVNRANLPLPFHQNR